MVNARSSWPRRLYQRIPFFAQCMLSYLLIMVLFFTVLYCVSQRAAAIARQNYLNERRNALETSIQSFSRQLDNFRAIPLTLQRTPYYMQLRLLTRNKITNRHYYAMSSLQDSFSHQCAMLEMENEAFLYLKNSGAVVSTASISFDAGKFFEDTLSFAEISADEMVEKLSIFSIFQEILPVRVSGRGTDGACVLFLYRRTNESAVYGLLLRNEVIARLFRLDELPAGTQLQFWDGETLLLSSGETQAPNTREKREYLEAGVPSLSLMVRLAIPEDYFIQMTASLTTLNQTYIVVTVSAGLVLSVLLAMFGQIPVRQLLRLTPSTASGRVCRNEFLALSSSILQSADENRQLRMQIDSGKALLRLNLLARLLAQESYTAADAALAAEHLPQLAHPSRILCLWLVSDGQDDELSDFAAFHAMEWVQTLFPPISLMVQMRQDLFALLVSHDEKSLAAITDACKALRDHLNPYGIALNAGLSEPFSSLEGLHNAYLHAQFSLRYFSVPISVFHPAEAGDPFRFIDLSRFHNAVLGCEADAAQAQLDRLLEAAQQETWVPKALHFILDSICGEMNLSPAAPGASLGARTEAVISTLAAQKNEYADTLVDAVLTWLEENHADSSLSAESISSHFSVSKSYLYRAFRESLGLTPIEKLEQIRMTHANALLLTTRMSVNAVAAACGYNSSNTFYKAYKKCYSRSPNAARPACAP